MIERIHLTILREIENHGSLTAAAQALHLTQSALSHAIKKLEQQIGTALWRKEGRQLQLTQAGSYLLKEGKRLLPQLERIDEVLTQYASGDLGTLRIGMECHPCYQWLLGVVSDFLKQWPGVDIDVKQRFQFGGMAALFNKEVDVLVTPDPLVREGICFTPVFAYEQVLVVGAEHPLATKDYIQPEDLIDQTLFTYPVSIERLDIYSNFLIPANCMPKNRKVIEATEIMLQFVAAHRGVTTLPGWLVAQHQQQLGIKAVRIGKQGLQKHIHLGTREEDAEQSLASNLIELAKAKHPIVNESNY